MRRREVCRGRRRVILLATAAALLAACEHPIGIITPHVEAADLLVADSTGALLARTEFNRSWSIDSLVLRDGAPLHVVLTAIDFRGEVIAISERGDLAFRMDAEDPALLVWEPRHEFGRIHVFGSGSTRIRFLIWHDSHADFVSPWLPVAIRAATASEAAQEVSP